MIYLTFLAVRLVFILSGIAGHLAQFMLSALAYGLVSLATLLVDLVLHLLAIL
jgi:hypothetical protein